jgi:signal transduction histidine kinase
MNVVKELSVTQNEVPEHLTTVIFRILQESLHNAVKHSRAGRISVSLKKRDGNLELVVQDDGVGFDTGVILSMRPADERLGLDGMRERAELTEGTLSIDSVKGEGTTVRASWPIATLPQIGLE